MSPTNHAWTSAKGHSGIGIPDGVHLDTELKVNPNLVGKASSIP